MGAPDFHFMDK
uniref:Uncharacterized protein n=1 Tax=Rhizophora mucronata TaxID=61149 RepID=A0A2P2J665_RHIMU